ncbi:FkbM family methyltransferase [Floridanema evergladense]|uniref:FkbM family methyltransferase n=1 Tax=Floridaenema evergladense BLCC-F167 TaxID=3153639 RepID=A0ABV4WP96_9CYAN
MENNFAEAIAFYQKSIDLNPQDWEAYKNLANLWAINGNLEQAITCYQKVIYLNPNLAEVHNNLGNCFLAKNQLEDAIAAYQNAVTLNPKYPEAFYNLGNACKAKGDLATAKINYQKTISLKPNFPEVHNNLGLVLQEEGYLAEAINCYEQAIRLNPEYAEAHNNLGNAFEEEKNLEKAIACYQQSLALNPNYIDAYNNLGNVLLSQGKAEEAIACYQKALELNPNYVQAHYNYANALKYQDKWDEAIAQLEYTLTLEPNFAEAHKNLGISLLIKGEFARGFAEYEWRWHTKEYRKIASFQPLWHQGDLQAKKILLLCEQGFGDNIHFIRYAPLIAQQGAHITLACYEELYRLFSTVPGVEEIVTSGTTVEYDYCAATMSLPYLMGTTAETIPANIPYLFPPKTTSIILEAPPETYLKIGIVWAGNPGNTNDRNRSCSLLNFLPLLDIPGIAFYSLQKGAKAQDLTALNLTSKIQDIGEKITDFADTAATINQLDLVICVDTSVAHLAGAMGKTVWVLLSKVADWRWMLEGENNPWYPTLRLFRQTNLGDWQPVFQKVALELEKMISELKNKEMENKSTEQILLPASGFNKLKKCRHGVLLYNINDLEVGKSLEAYGEYKEGEIELLQQIIKPQDLVLEVGTNIGVHTVYFAQAVGEQGTVLAFEPQRVIFQNLCANLAINSITNTYCYNVAVSDTFSTINLPILDYSKPQDFSKLDISENGESELAQTITLDSLNLPHCRLIKIDVSGMELAVLQGAINTIKSLHPILYINYQPKNDKSLINFLVENGYKLYWHKVLIYNPNNYLENPENVFGKAESNSIFCIPSNLELELKSDKLKPVNVNK